MNEAIIFAAGSLLVMMLVAFSFTGDLKNASRETNTGPAYCIESHPDYDREKCGKWRRAEEERLLKEWEQESVLKEPQGSNQGRPKEDCECPAADENGEESEDPLHKWRRLQCERVCKDTNKAKPD